MRCAICKKTSDEVKLFNGIFESEMITVCENCAENESIPIIKKPSSSQLNRADKKYSVRERMEIMSGFRDKTEISEEQMITQGNLARLKMPPKKEQHEDIVDNYYWEVGMARKRRKLTTAALAEKVGTTPEVIRQIERGIIPKDFEQLFVRLEDYLQIRLLKNRANKVNFVRNNPEIEKQILESVKEKMGDPSSEEAEELTEIAEDIEEDELDAKKKKKKGLFGLSIGNISRKKNRRKEKKEAEIDVDDELEGDDLDLIEEL